MLLWRCGYSKNEIKYIKQLPNDEVVSILEMVRKNISILGKEKRIIKDKDVFVALTNYADSSLTYTIRVWVNSGDFFNVKFDLLEKIKEQFDEKKIEIPYNQLDVHINQK